MKPQEPTVAVRPRTPRHKTARHSRHANELHTQTRARSRREVAHENRPELELVPPVAPQSAPQAEPLSPEENRQFKKLVQKKVPCAPCHWGLLVSALLLCALSVPLVYSASTAIALDQHGGDPNFFLLRQLMNVAAGIVMMVLVSRVSPEKTRKVAWALYFVAVAGLLLTKFSPLGFSMGNVERWVKLGPVTFQFSELAKIALVGVMADYWKFSVKRSQKSMRPWGGALLIAAIPVGLTFMQPHLSAALVLAVIPFIVAWIAGVPGKHFARIGAIAGLFLAVVVGMCKTHSVPFLAHYQQDRIAAHVFGGDDQGNNYQQLQGERAIMRGGVAGVGLGGSLYKNGHLPAPHTDFIFAVIAEEIGAWGSLLLISLYASIVFFCFQIGHATNDRFQKLLCSGVGALWAVQAIGNILVVSGALPVTGMPLPILTYGGSGLWCALLGLGLVLSVSRAHCEEN